MGISFFNRLFGGKRHFVLPPLPAAVANSNGILPMPLVVDDRTGTETVLLWLDRTGFAEQLASVRPFTLMMKAMAYRSDYGPLACLLFYVPDPKRKGEVFAATEAYLNLANRQALQPWFDLARQSHWHVAIVGAGDHLHDFFEFKNAYGLERVLALDENERNASYSTPGFDIKFEKAKEEFMQNFSMADLLSQCDSASQ